MNTVTEAVLLKIATSLQGHPTLVKKLLKSLHLVLTVETSLSVALLTESLSQNTFLLWW